MTEAEYTRIGRWLKASQLDEIPQLLERPARRDVVRRPTVRGGALLGRGLATDLPAYWQRLVVLPGTDRASPR